MDEPQAVSTPPGDARRRVRRRTGIPLGRIFGIPLFLTLPWVAVSIAITFGYGQIVQRRFTDLTAPLAYLLGLGLVASLLISVLLHELGHALTARRYGVEVRRITLDLLGGNTELGDDLPRPGVEMVVALVGPAVSLLVGLLGLAGWALLPAETVLRGLAFQLAFSNLVVALYNALPGLPLDGGRALRAGVWAVSGRRALGDRVAGWAGRLVAVATFALGLAGYVNHLLGLLGLALFAVVAGSLWGGAGQAVRYARIIERIPALSVAGLSHRLVGLPAGTSLAQALAVKGELDDLGVVDGAGRVVGVVNPVTAAKVPEQRRPWVTMEHLSVAVAAADWLPADLSGHELVNRIAALDSPVDPWRPYLVRLGEDEVGVLRVAYVAYALTTGKQ